MEYSAIFHDMDKRFCYAVDKDLFVIRVQVKKDDMKEIILHYEDKYIPMELKDTRKTIPMKKAATSQFHDYYEVQLQMHLVCLRYFFEFTDMQGEKVYYGNYEFSRECITNRDRMFDCPQNLREEEMFEVPEWAANKVVYQIFPARFAASQPVDRSQWYKAPITSADNLHGDLRGIIEHLDYIRELGIDVLYMTPIFKANSCHKYDTIDYYHIDPSFGTKQELRELVQKAHERGMKVVMDAVFNHTGREFFAFADILEKGEKSKYRDWYFIDDFPLRNEPGQLPNFKCFAYYGGMPKLNLKNPEVEKFVTDVACYWIEECDIDGWRMDVGDELSHSYPFLKPHAADLLGEICRRFQDSLRARGGGAYRPKVTSLLRTPLSVGKLRRVNRNATGESAHQYATTFDISYSKFICDNAGDTHRTFEDLKNLLAEILYDLRAQGRCYVKFEYRQSCFHITTRPPADAKSITR